MKKSIILIIFAVGIIGLNIFAGDDTIIKGQITITSQVNIPPVVTVTPPSTNTSEMPPR